MTNSYLLIQHIANNIMIGDVGLTRVFDNLVSEMYTVRHTNHQDKHEKSGKVETRPPGQVHMYRVKKVHKWE